MEPEPFLAEALATIKRRPGWGKDKRARSRRPDKASEDEIASLELIESHGFHVGVVRPGNQRHVSLLPDLARLHRRARSVWVATTCKRSIHDEPCVLA
jgi:hypothetical protein